MKRSARLARTLSPCRSIRRKSPKLCRRQLRLPFRILCDTDRHVVQEWDVYNPHEKGGIAKPAIFIIDRDRAVRCASVDTVSSRVSALEVVRILRTTSEARLARRKPYIPTPVGIFRAIRNYIGLRRRQSG